MRIPDSRRWSRLSPLLDELLELDAAARVARVAKVREADAELADELATLLTGGSALERDKLVGLMLGAMGDSDSPLTQRQILERSVGLIEKTFGSEPSIAVELLLPIAGQYYTLGDEKNDYAVMQRAAAFAAASGDANLVAKVACDTINTHVKAGRMAAAESQLRIATQALARSADPQPGVRIECLTAEADLARGQGDTVRALQRISLALDLSERAGETGGNTYPSMLSLLGVLQQDAGDLPGSLSTQERLMRLDEKDGRTLDYLVTERNAPP